MSINFATLQGLTIPEGVVTQITDAAGRVLWMAGGPVILQVEKITDTTYVGETTYENEQFILLDIYPKTNGTVTVTYGGLTKTITDTSGAEEPNAQEVIFGTFGGVAYDTTSPASGELTIEGDYYAFGCGGYSTNKYSVAYCGCITDIISFGGVTVIPHNAFRSCAKLTKAVIPNKITSFGPSGVTGQYVFGECTSLEEITIHDRMTALGYYTFQNCSKLVSIELPHNLTIIGGGEFSGCTGLTSVIIPANVNKIVANAFQNCTGLTSVVFENPSGWHVLADDATTTIPVDVSSPTDNVKLLTDTYYNTNWERI